MRPRGQWHETAERTTPVGSRYLDRRVAAMIGQGTGTAWQGAGQDQRPVVVGISRESGSITALTWAWHEARLRHAPLVAVTAWRPPLPSPGPAPRPTFAPISVEETHQQVEEDLVRLVQRVIGSEPEITTQAIKGGTTGVLIKAAAGAQLLVLGAPQPNRASGLVTSRRVHRLTTSVACPVVVMPSTTDSV